MIDSIASLHTAMSQQQLQTQVSAAVAEKSMDVTEMKGEAVAKLLEGAKEVSKTQVQDPALGQNIDIQA